MAKKLKRAAAKAPKKIEFHLIKSNYFRVVKGDGVFGGLTPQGEISASFFSERQPLPRKLVHTLEDGQPGPEITDERETRTGIIREMEVSVVMNLSVATAFHEWLGTKIVELQAALMKQADKAPVTKGKSDDTLH